MGGPAYSCRALVLKRTDLGEADCVVTMLRDDGSLLRAVAKGARRPKGTFATRLDLFCVSDLLVAPGRSLDVVSEARLVEANLPLRSDIVRAAAASPVLESLSRCAQEDLPVPRLFDMACAALRQLAACQPNAAPAVCAAFLLKLFAVLGARPQLSCCISCGGPVDLRAAGQVDFSFADGGVTCVSCASSLQHVRVDARTLQWAAALLGATFAQVADMGVDPRTSFSLLELCNRWLLENLSTKLKSLSYLFTCGLF